ncbi:MAG: dsDNA nuclease domain-containing protein [Candidatus Electronema sp. V4]|uniref:dsDNA nuclease domain-containing protein n=1 Tax=Candidatus Electronema sp. V4 TaxID=3454756 RepID=UPI0040559C34
MTNSLAHKLAITKPRENAGSRSANRFDYQKDWAICELLKLYLAQKDFLLILDYHEDIVVLDSESVPKKAIFYQIKSKRTGNWTVAELCRAASGKKH